jgi:hypothetical protein
MAFAQTGNVRTPLWARLSSCLSFAPLLLWAKLSSSLIGQSLAAGPPDDGARTAAALSEPEQALQAQG